MWYSIKTFIKWKQILWYSIKTIMTFFPVGIQLRFLMTYELFIGIQKSIDFDGFLDGVDFVRLFSEKYKYYSHPTISHKPLRLSFSFKPLSAVICSCQVFFFFSVKFFIRLALFMISCFFFFFWHDFLTFAFFFLSESCLTDICFSVQFVVFFVRISFFSCVGFG